MKIGNIHTGMVFRDESLTKRVLFADKNVLCFLLNLKPGQSVPMHRHETSTLVLTVLQGKGTIGIGGETAEFGEGDFLSVKGDEDFGVPNVTENLTLMVTLSPNPTDQRYSQEV